MGRAAFKPATVRQSVTLLVRYTRKLLIWATTPVEYKSVQGVG
jgi:hypothetical protein